MLIENVRIHLIVLQKDPRIVDIGMPHRLYLHACTTSIFTTSCNRRFRVVVLEKSTESIVGGENDKYMDHREHQTGLDTGVKSDKGCIKLLWARGENRRDGR